MPCAQRGEHLCSLFRVDSLKASTIVKLGTEHHRRRVNLFGTKSIFYSPERIEEKNENKKVNSNYTIDKLFRAFRYVVNSCS